MFLETGLFVAMVSIGAVADQLVTDSAKSRLGNFLLRVEHARWRQFIANMAYSSYVYVFSPAGTSRRFIQRSLMAYLLLSATSFIFLYVFFPSTFAEISSVFRFGNSTEVFSWIVCCVLGSGIYVVANLQTLYFLDILKSSPSLFTFVLVAYADFLLTASIALFGVAGVMTFHTYNSVTSAGGEVPMQVSFYDAAQTISDDNRPFFEESLGAEVAATLEDQKRAVTLKQAKLVYLRTRAYHKQEVADFEAMRAAIQSGSTDGLILADGNLRYLRRAVIFPGDDEASAPSAQGALLVAVQGAPDFKGQTCDGVHLGRGNHAYVNATLSREDLSKLINACKTSQSAIISPLLSYNVSKVDWTEMYTGYMLNGLNEMWYSLRSGFQSYLSVSPYRLLSEPDSAAWGASARNVQSREDNPLRLNGGVLKILSTQNGSDFVHVVRSVPAGTMNFVILSTSVFLALVMSLAALTFPIVVSITRIAHYSSLVDIRRFPVTVTCIILGFWGTILLLIVRA